MIAALFGCGGGAAAPPDAAPAEAPADAARSPDASPPRLDAATRDAPAPPADAAPFVPDGPPVSGATVELTGTVRDLYLQAPVHDATVGILGYSSQTHADDLGRFRLQVPENAPFYLYGYAPGYLRSNLPRYTATAPLDVDSVGPFLLVPEDFFRTSSMRFGTLAPGRGFIIAQVRGVAGSRCAARRDGFVVSATNAPGVRVLYGDATGLPDPSLSQTQSAGIAILVDVPPGEVTVLAIDPMGTCTSTEQSTATTRVEAGVVSFARVLVR